MTMNKAEVVYVVHNNNQIISIDIDIKHYYYTYLLKTNILAYK